LKEFQSRPVEVTDPEPLEETIQPSPETARTRIFSFDPDQGGTVPIDSSNSNLHKPDSLEWLMKLHGEEVGRDIYESKQVRRNLQEQMDDNLKTKKPRMFTPTSVDKEESNSFPPYGATTVSEPRIMKSTGITPEDRHSAKRAENVQKKITQIESKAFGWIDRRIGDVSSPVNQLAEAKFSEFESLLSMSKRDFMTFTDNEYRGADLKYEAFQQWAPYLKGLVNYSETLSTSKRTTQAVVEGFVAKKWDL
jgi:hypothetical protein